MARGYTRTEILEKIEASARDMATFYQQDFVNYRGCTLDTGEFYTEVAAEWCCSHLDLLDAIPQITRETSYKTPGHDGTYDPASCREEEITAMQMYRYCADGGSYDGIGKIIDYQTPLKNRRTDTAGKIDLLAYDGSCLRILEMKKADSQETMLRCVLEGFTYRKTVDGEKLLRDFELPADTKIEACPFVFAGSGPYLELCEERPHLRKLMDMLHSRAFLIRKTEDGFAVSAEAVCRCGKAER
ncbi:MAG: hypothetical protein PUE84_04410 [Firmicutes bacterium]|nr:hypothetical protein [Bacillota bacterium]